MGGSSIATKETFKAGFAAAQSKSAYEEWVCECGQRGTKGALQKHQGLQDPQEGSHSIESAHLACDACFNTGVIGQKEMERCPKCCSDLAAPTRSVSDSPHLMRKLDGAALAQKFHETYERLAPQFGYQTRKESAGAWESVPEKNRQLMIAVATEILSTTQPDEQKTQLLRELRDDIIEQATDTLWVGLTDTVCERLTMIIGDDWGADGDTSSLRSRQIGQGDES